MSPNLDRFLAKISSSLFSSWKKRIFSNNKTSPGFNLFVKSIASESIFFFVKVGIYI